MLKLPGVTEDEEGNVLIPLKINDKISITMPNGDIITYSLSADNSLMRAATGPISVMKGYSPGNSAISAVVKLTAECNWANRIVTINRSYHDVTGKNPYGTVSVSNKENTIIDQSGDTATAEAAGNITFTMTMAGRTETKLVPYRIQIIVDAADSSSATLKVLR